MRKEYLVNGVKRYSFISKRPEDNGKKIEGAKLVITNEKYEEYSGETGSFRGHKNIEINIPYDEYDKVKKVPGIYEIEFEEKTYQGKQYLKYKDMGFKKEVNIADVI